MPTTIVSRAPVGAGLVLAAIGPLAPWTLAGAGGGPAGPVAWRSALESSATAGSAVGVALVGVAVGVAALAGRPRVAGAVATFGGAAIGALALLGWSARTEVEAAVGAVWWAPGPAVTAVGGMLVLGGGIRLWRAGGPAPSTGAEGARPTPGAAPAGAAVALCVLALFAATGPWWVEPGVAVLRSGGDAVPMLRGTEVLGGWAPLAVLVAVVAGTAALGWGRPVAAAALAGGGGGLLAVLGAVAVAVGATHGTARPVVAVGLGAASTVVALVALGATGRLAPWAAGGTVVPALAMAPLALVVLPLPAAGPTVATSDGAVPVRVLAGSTGGSGLRPGLDAGAVGEAVRVLGAQPAPGTDGDLLAEGGGTAELLLASREALVAVRDHRVRPLRTIAGLAPMEIVGRTGGRTVLARVSDGALSVWDDGATAATGPGGHDLRVDGADAASAPAVGPDGSLWLAVADGPAHTRLLRWAAAEVAMAVGERGGLGPGRTVARWAGPVPRRVVVGAAGVAAVVDPDHTVRVVAEGRVEVVARPGRGCGPNDAPDRLGAASVLRAVPGPDDEVWLLVDTGEDTTGGGDPSDLAVRGPTRAVWRVADGTVTDLAPGGAGPLDVRRAVGLGHHGRELIVSDEAGRVVALVPTDDGLTALPAPAPGCEAAG